MATSSTSTGDVHPCPGRSVPELLDTFDADVARSVRVLASVDDEAVTRPWRMKIRGAVRFERPKALVFRDFTLSHLIHHRGQLSVYLRLLDVPCRAPMGQPRMSRRSL